MDAADLKNGPRLASKCRQGRAGAALPDLRRPLAKQFKTIDQIVFALLFFCTFMKITHFEGKPCQKDIDKEYFVPKLIKNSKCTACTVYVYLAD